ncbi:Probable serine/threonine-protein kinase SCO3848 [Durusdinium trenchii]|uniref:NEK6-subfamily protein kinase n=1 Tax=Durusdinium trenchii TaxID=1381693 RepID=A0ABP0PTX0_9DINO
MSRDRRTEAILAEYLRRIDAGEQVDLDAICQAHPQLAKELTSYAAGGKQIDVGSSGKIAHEHEQGSSSRERSARQTVSGGSTASGETIWTGRTFGRYRIESLLGEGTMGTVLSAVDPQLKRRVALKIPKIVEHAREEFLTRFRREAEAAAALNHPGICPVFDVGEVDGTPYITMAFIDGVPLSKLMQKHADDPEWMVRILHDVAEALDHAHASGIVPRDLKPGNVLVDRSGRPIVTDFGLARRIGESDEARLTHDGMIVGTPTYMSPEQVEVETGQIGPKSDIYALGVILYEFLAGQPPFQGSVASILAQIVRDRPKHPGRLRRTADPGLCDLCLEMMAKDITKRPDSMRDVAFRLETWLAKPSPAEAEQQKEAQRRQEKLEKAKQRIIDLTQRGQYAQAMTLLEKLAAVTDADAVGYATWARDEIKRVRKLPKKVRAGIPALVHTAQELMQNHDYGQAAEALQQIPRELRTPEVNTLLKKAIDLQDEADLLMADLQQCVGTRRLQGIEENLKRFLQLKPRNRFARELRETLRTYRKVPVREREYRFDDKGNLLPHRSGMWTTLLACLVVGGIAFGTMSWAMARYLGSSNETLTIRVDQSVLDDGPVTLVFDDNEHQIAHAELRLNVPPGTYPYEVRQGNAVLMPAAMFTVRDEGVNLLEIRGPGGLVAPGRPAVTQWVDLIEAASHDYDDFELEFEWRIEKGGNSGVYYRSPGDQMVEVLAYPGTEYQLLDNDGHPNGGNPKTTTGSLYGIVAPSENALRPVGSWNESRIVADGAEVTHWLNGKPVVRYAIGSSEWKEALAVATNPRLRANVGRSTGAIALQGHTGEVAFRRVRIRKLVDPPSNQGQQFNVWYDLFNGRDLAGWLTGTNESWRVDDGVLESSGPEASLVYTAEQFSDFHCQIEFQINGTGHGGLVFRSPTITVGNAGYETHFANVGDRTTGEVTRLGSDSAEWGDGSYVAVSAWHTADIFVRGSHLVTRINGQTIVDTVDDEAVTSEGYLALRHADANTRFRVRRVRIRRLGPNDSSLAGGVPEELDLLSSLRLPSSERDWRKSPSGSQLVFEGRGGKPLLLPGITSSNYEVTARVTADPELNQLVFVLPTADGLCAVVLRNHATTWGGLEMVDGMPYMQGSAHLKEKLLPGKQIELKLRVDSDDSETRIDVESSGKNVLTWSGATRRLRLSNHWDHGFANRLAIGAGQDQSDVGKASAVIQTLRFRDLSGGAGLELGAGSSLPATAARYPFPSNARFTNSRSLAELNQDQPVNGYPWLSIDGRTIYWTREGRGVDSAIMQATRSSPDAPFGGIRKILQPTQLDIGQFPEPTEIPALRQIRNPKGTAFSDDGKSLLIFGLLLGNVDGQGLYRAERSRVGAPWGPPRSVRIEGTPSDMQRFQWPSLASGGKHLVFAFAQTNRLAMEWGAVADVTDDPLRFINPRPLLLDGKRFMIRGGRYCAATGELFYTHPLDEPPYSKFELRVARSSGLASSTTTTASPSRSSPFSDGPGLRTTLYRGENFDEQVLQRVDESIDWFWMYNAPDRGVPRDHYSIRWEGWLRAPEPGTYQLTFVSDDGVRLWLDDQLLIEDWTGHLPRRYDRRVTLGSKPIKVKVEYFEDNLLAAASLRWSKPGRFDERPITDDYLFQTRRAAERASVPMPTERTGEYGLRVQKYKGKSFSTLAHSASGREISLPHCRR